MIGWRLLLLTCKHGAVALAGQQKSNSDNRAARVARACGPADYRLVHLFSFSTPAAFIDCSRIHLISSASKCCWCRYPVRSLRHPPPTPTISKYARRGWRSTHAALSLASIPPCSRTSADPSLSAFGQAVATFVHTTAMLHYR